MNSGHHYQARLRQGHWFSALPVALQEALLAAAQVQQLAPGQVLFRRGDKPCGLYAVVEGGMRIVALRLDARGAWEIDLDNGVRVRLGRRQVDERFERFVAAALPLVAQRSGDIDYVDMRYTNGFAVGWRGGADGAAGA